VFNVYSIAVLIDGKLRPILVFLSVKHTILKYHHKELAIILLEYVTIIILYNSDTEPGKKVIYFIFYAF